MDKEERKYTCLLKRFTQNTGVYIFDKDESNFTIYKDVFIHITI